jgi:protein CpxP
MRNLAQNKWVLGLLALLLVANISLLLGFFVFGEGPEGRKGAKEDNFKAFSEKMRLTPAQDTLLRKMKQDHNERMKPLWEEIRKTKDTLYRQLGEANGGDSIANAVSLRLSALNHEADMKTFRHFQEVRNECTPEQRAIFDTLIPKWMSRPWNGGRKPAQKN